ncbi:MAG: CRISPR system precrRNA processing endoribonuclease RAMP protein Cas6, partial [Candidatus Thermofonsia bacterium]
MNFQGRDGPLDGHQIFARGYHGLLFNVLQQSDTTAATWLHKHRSPKPFSVVPYYNLDGHLTGLRYALLTEDATDIFYRAWMRVYSQKQILKLGHQPFVVSNLEVVSGPDCHRLAETAVPQKELTLHFLSPTAFKQGPGHLPLPLPGNVFHWPLRVWQAYAPPALRLQMPDTWLNWCRQNIFVTEHQIETAAVSITYKETFTGFVGQVTFNAYKGGQEYLRIWQTLGHLAAFSGVGHKTTMGMGAVTIVEN